MRKALSYKPRYNYYLFQGFLYKTDPTQNNGFMLEAFERHADFIVNTDAYVIKDRFVTNQAYSGKLEEIIRDHPDKIPNITVKTVPEFEAFLAAKKEECLLVSQYATIRFLNNS